jgi:hypothetical protein
VKLEGARFGHAWQRAVHGGPKPTSNKALRLHGEELKQERIHTMYLALRMRRPIRR